MPKRSLRTVLTAWNAVLLAGLLGALGMAIVLGNQNRLRKEIDDDLVRSATQATRGGPPPPPPDDGFRHGPDDGPHHGHGGGFGGGPPGGPDFGDGPPGGPPPNPYAAATRIADVRRPRFFNAEGHPMHERDNPAPFDQASLKAALAGNPGFATTTLDGEKIRVYSRAMRHDGHIDGAVQFAHELTDLDLLWNAQLWTLAAVLPVAILLAAGTAFFLTGRTLKPVAQLTATASEIGRSGDLSRRLDATGEDEIAVLAKTFNEMLGKLEGSFRDLEQAFSKLEVAYEQQQRFAADASHELRTPLTRLRLATSSALAGKATPDEMRSALASADRAAETMTKLVGQLLTLARADAGETHFNPHPVDLRVVVAEGLDQLTNGQRVLTAFSDEPVMVNADAEQLHRVVLNLVENALRHTPEPGTVTVSTYIESGEARLDVRDTGEGIATEHLAHLGERFYRVDAARTRKDGGAGLGLAICANIVRSHGGHFAFESELGKGTTVRATFPLFLTTARKNSPVK